MWDSSVSQVNSNPTRLDALSFAQLTARAPGNDQTLTS